MLRAVGIFFGFLVLLRLLWAVRSILIVTFLGVLFGLALSAAVEPLHARFQIKRGIAASLIAAAFIALLAGLGVLVAPTVRDQARQLSQRLPEVVERVERWLGGTSGQGQQVGSQPRRGSVLRPAGAGPAAAPPETSPMPAQSQPRGDATAPQQSRQPSLRDQLGRQLGGLLQYLFPFVSGTAAAATGVVLTVFLAIYIASEPRLYRKGLLHLFPHRMRKRADEVLVEIGDSLQRWLIARLLAMLSIGAITTAALLVLRVESALVLGMIAGLLEFIPLFGPIVASIPAIGLALAESPQKAIWVALAFVVIQQIEGNVVTPLLLKKRVDIPPALTIVTVAVMGLLFGFLGLLVAEPLLAATLVAVKMLWVEDVVGDDV